MHYIKNVFLKRVPKAGPDLKASPIREIIRYALLAPSGDNCQPWRITLNGEIIQIFHNQSRGQHELNRRNHASFLTLGCLLEAIEIASSAYNMKCEIRNIDITNSVEKPWVTMKIFHEKRAIDQLFPVLSMRTTERRPYRGGSPFHWVFSQIQREVSSRYDTKLYFSNNYPRSLLNYIAKCEEFIWRHRAAHTDLFRWLRFGRRDVSDDGMPWQTLGIGFVESRLLKTCQSWINQTFLNRIGFLWMIRRASHLNIKSSAALGIVTVNDLSSGCLVEAGRVFFRAWLRLNRSGFAFQPLTVCSLGIFDLKACHSPNDLPQWMKENLIQGQVILAKEFGFGPDELPVWMFRTGIAPDDYGRRPIKTPRISVDEVFEDITNQTP